MITKFSNIKSTGVFQDFVWDKNLKSKKSEEIILFDKINIFYGQNYSGKSTLSRIIRSFETGNFSDKYENAEYSIGLNDGSELKHSGLQRHNRIFRVFNEDFITENLKFIVDPSEHIMPFAILGELNQDLETEIENLENELGNENEKTGLFGDLVHYQNKIQIYKDELNNITKSLDKKLSDKATGKINGIKYQKKFDKITYDISKLRIDIEKIQEEDFEKLTRIEKIDLEDLLQEKLQDPIKEIIPPSINFNEIQESVASVITKVVGKSNKIDKLVKDAVLNRWVKEGRSFHKENSKCKFCEGFISENRWKELEKHFDEESENLEKAIDKLLVKIEQEEKNFRNIIYYRKDNFYKKFQEEYSIEERNLKNCVERYLKILAKFKKHIIQRKNDLLNAADYIYESDISYNLTHSLKAIDDIRIKANSYSKSLKNDQIDAREKLRLQEVYEFAHNIDLYNTNQRIKYLKNQLLEIEQDEMSVIILIDKIKERILENKKSITDETKGAELVNEYLNNHFGHTQLSLQPVETVDFLYGFSGNKIFFEIQRDGKKAFNLSEGERSLIAFCYFIAKLKDIETVGKKPIVWIDDPISSLDGNHIFFVYSLIKAELYNKKDFEQLFISTHNLNFLKYLKKLQSHNDEKKQIAKYFLIERTDKESIIKEMPRYLKDHVTEFNHLFKNIYECHLIKNVDDSNYVNFYNFGNNARKFLEIYLFYKYPNYENEDAKKIKFFGEDIPKILTDRVTNEYSHLCGIIERGENPIDLPEMKKTADLIIEKLKEKDLEQYEALVKSVENC